MVNACGVCGVSCAFLGTATSILWLSVCVFPRTVVTVVESASEGALHGTLNVCVTVWDAPEVSMNPAGEMLE